MSNKLSRYGFLVLLVACTGLHAALPKPQDVAELLTKGTDVRPKAKVKHVESPDAHVVIFMGANCPLAKKYLPRAVADFEKYQTEYAEGVGKAEHKPSGRNPRGKVQYYFVYSSQGEKKDRVLEIAEGSETKMVPLPFPVFYEGNDEKQPIASLLGARMLSETFIFDAKFNLVYRGAYDDQFTIVEGVSAERKSANYEYAKLTVADLFAGQSYYTESIASGCDIERPRALGKTKYTYHRDIAPLISKKCEICHGPNGVMEDYSFSTYEDVKASLTTIARRVGQRVMPPWGAHSGFGKFRNDISLNDEQVRTILEWVEAGAPEGTAPKANPVPKPEGKKAFFSLGKPDYVFKTSTTKIPKASDQSRMPYVFFDVEAPIDEDRWVEWSEVVPSNPKIVHHVTVYVRPPKDTYYREPNSVLYGFAGSEDSALKDFASKTIKYRTGIDPDALWKSVEIYGIDGFKKFAYLGVYVPGWRTVEFAKDTSFFLRKGSKIRVEIHYTPVAKETEDFVTVGVKWADPKRAPKHELETMAFGKVNSLKIPANAENHVVVQSYEFPAKAALVLFRPHAHLRGRWFRYEILRPKAKDWETVLYVPRYDFKNQPYYMFEEPVVAEKGTKIRMSVGFNNSTSNRYITAEQADSDVYFGAQTDEEMAFGYVNFAWLEEPPDYAKTK